MNYFYLTYLSVLYLRNGKSMWTVKLGQVINRTIEYIHLIINSFTTSHSVCVIIKLYFFSVGETRTVMSYGIVRGMRYQDFLFISNFILFCSSLLCQGHDNYVFSYFFILFHTQERLWKWKGFKGLWCSCSGIIASKE